MDSSEKDNRRTPDFTRWPVRGVAICAAGMAIGFGLCSVGLVTGRLFDLKDFGAGMFVLCFGGLVVSAVWFVVAAVVSAIVSDTAEERARRAKKS